MAAKAGCTAFRKLMRRYPGFTLEPTGNSHMCLVDPTGSLVRHSDGRKFTITSSPRNQDKAAKEIIRQLSALGIEGRA